MDSQAICLVVLTCLVVSIEAVGGVKGSRVGLGAGGSGHGSGAGSSSGAYAAAGTALLAGAAAAAWQICLSKRAGSPAPVNSARVRKGLRCGSSATSAAPAMGVEPEPSSDAECEKCPKATGRYDDNDDWFVDPEEDAVAADEAAAPGGKLWTSDVFPAGVYGAANWETANLNAVLEEWRCPCPDRNCLTKERLGSEAVIILYEHRKRFRTVDAKKFGRGGLRDAWRSELERHWDEQTASYSRSFRIGPVGDCCVASSALAKGLSFNTHSNARGDVRFGRPWHAGRARAASQQDSYERGHLKAYIRSLKAKMEGTKGGKPGADKWHTGYMPMSKRWAAYVKMRTDAGLPVIGKQSLFAQLWKEWSDIVEDKACGHPDCDYCGELAADRVKFEGNKQKLEEIEAKQVY